MAGFWPSPSPSRWKTIKVSSAQAIVGARQRHNHGTVGTSASPALPRLRRLSPADGGRGRQARHCVSFFSFISDSFQFGFYFLQAVAVTARRRVGGNFQPPANFLKGAAVPHFQ